MLTGPSVRPVSSQAVSWNMSDSLSQSGTETRERNKKKTTRSASRCCKLERRRAWPPARSGLKFVFREGVARHTRAVAFLTTRSTNGPRDELVVWENSPMRMHVGLTRSGKRGRGGAECSGGQALRVEMKLYAQAVSLFLCPEPKGALRPC